MSDKTKEDLLRHFSRFLEGPNFDALIETLASEAENLENLAVAVTDQLTISTASGAYLDKKLSDVGITRPPELGMSDFSFREMGIAITARKQIPSLIHKILETFYGTAAVRALTTSGNFGPYNLDDGMELFLALEDDELIAIPFTGSDFVNINAATPAEVAAVITRVLRTRGYKGFAEADTDVTTNKTYVRIYGGAAGPYSSITILGGEAQTKLRFPSIRPTEVSPANTSWQVTRTVGTTLRFRWNGNSKPALEQVKPGDQVLLYGVNFKSFELEGTFTITDIRPAVAGPDLDAGWFEIDNPAFAGLKSTVAGLLPAPNVPPDTYFSFNPVQVSNDDVVFMLAQRSLPNSKARYALAYETGGSNLKIYLPATAGVVSRGLPGGSYLHVGKDADTFNGSFGNAQQGIDDTNGQEVTEVVCTEDVAGSLGGSYWFVPVFQGQLGVWYSVAGSPIAPPTDIALYATHDVQVDLDPGDTADIVATKTKAALDATTFFSSVAIATETLTITDAIAGPRTPDALPATSPFAITVLQQGVFIYNLIGDKAFAEKLQVIGENAVKFKQSGYDMDGTGGTAIFDGGTPKAVRRVYREGFITTIILDEPHGLIFYDGPRGGTLSDSVVTLDVATVDTDQAPPDNLWPGPYAPDLTVNYTLQKEFVTTRERIFAGAALSTILVDGVLPQGPGSFWLDLNKDTGEGPFRYIGVQSSSEPITVNIVSITQSGTSVTISTEDAHGAVPGAQVQVAGTIAFDGVYTVDAAPNSFTIKATSGISQTASEVSGTVSAIVTGLRSTVSLDPSNEFNHNHDIGADMTLLSSNNAYTPAKDGSDYPFYITGTAQGRIFAEEIIQQVTALGVSLNIVIIYPSDKGLGNEGGTDSTDNPPTSDKVYVWGGDDIIF